MPSVRRAVAVAGWAMRELRLRQDEHDATTPRHSGESRNPF
ncbi:hypothetical protein GLE_1306 [Lysobacter enzymogenes]|uniref:Uncharacterized protein n=1 Tax=Lysobacter enzymogenes TaxID=69 RepID=A0A0S2DDQ1_LYSEN|nr:hypothetical protein GLE_1306 [Lysobacter enzymogenes]